MAGPRFLRRTGTQDQDSSKFERYVNQALVPLVQSPIVNGVLLKDVVLTAGQTTLVEHKLGRELLGWSVVRKRANSTVWDSQDSNQFSSKSLALQCSANVTVDLWVF